MLRSRADFARLATHGRTRTDRHLVVHFLPNALDHDRYGISTSKRVGGAVVRNRVRRRIRHILQASPEHGGGGSDVLIVARPSSAEASFEELRLGLERLLGLVHPVTVAS